MELNETQLDAMKELGNIGASHAATSLSTMLMSEIEMTVPEARIVDIADISEYFGDEISALVVFEIQGELHPGGYVVLHLPKKSAIRLTNTMLGSTDMDREFNEMDESALLEVGNIMVSQFLDATATLLGIVMLPSPPAIAIDMAHAAFANVVSMVAVDINQIILFRTELKSKMHDIESTIVMLPDEGTLEQILKILEDLVKSPQ
ncbi:chemotaxis protein CheC [Methanoplanus sp. FWC-SCC4]|uniref:Chemotaxis protein CheC n=1 Tax=Methanochimaera problematica TaxID=2609417 RepID=A0AA97FB22_9EURY|nr:chemotaxis protein CheC [Methanoplanus sp. FWC-SCC4]WOF15612.1 chemotaxis protein CheC [Methanoplanus sp. FWC-SCC4]